MAAVARVWLAGILVLCLAAAPRAQEPKSVALAKQLAAALDAAKLDALATAVPGQTDVFVGALYFPGVQLLVVSAKYAAPQAMTEQLAKKNYREVYLDLSSASVAATKVFVSDLGADGLVARPDDNQPFDTFETASKRLPLDGDWDQQGLSRDEYMSAFAAADTQYADMLTALIAQVKKGP
jgi:hypothetical protein